MSLPGPAGPAPLGHPGSLAAAESAPPDDLRQQGPAADLAGPASEGAAAAPGVPRRWLGVLLRLMRSKAVRVGFLALVFALLGITLAEQSSTLWREVQQLSAPMLLLAFALSIAGLVCNLMVWREVLADLGSRVSVAEAWRIYFIGGLSKYVPGAIWPVLAQAELGADRGVPRSRSALSVILCYAVMTSSGAVVAAITLPFATAGSVGQYFWILFLIPVGVLLLSPPVLNRLLRLVLRLARQSPDQQGVSYRGLARMMVWAIAAWTANGLFIYVLLRQLAGHPQGTLLVSVGAYALSWVVGFLAVFAPAGAGVREVVMVAVLHTHPAAIAVTVALASRAISVLADAVTGAAASALIGRRRLGQLRGARQVAAARAQVPGDRPPAPTPGPRPRPLG
jgi:glycosyltransferase 2 family protein